MQYKLLETYSVEYAFKKKEYGKMHLQSPVMIVDLSGVCVCVCVVLPLFSVLLALIGHYNLHRTVFCISLRSCSNVKCSYLI